MKSSLFRIAVFALVAGPIGVCAPCALAQNQRASVQASTAQPEVLSKGTVLVAEFTKSLNAKKLKPGDKVQAELTQDIVAHGKVLASVGSKLMGHVTEVNPGTKDGPQSKLGVVFDRLKLKHHKELAFLATVQVLAPPSNRPRRVDQPDQMLPPSMLGVDHSMGGGPIGGGGGSGRNSGSRASTSVSDPSQTLAATGNIDSAVTVAGTPGTSLGQESVPVNLPKSASTNNRRISGGLGAHGVYGLKDIALGPADNQTPGPVILSSKSAVKLENGTQVVLLVTGPSTLVDK